MPLSPSTFTSVTRPSGAVTTPTRSSRTLRRLSPRRVRPRQGPADGRTGRTSKGRSHVVRRASALATTSSVSSRTSTGIRSISPPVRFAAPGGCPSPADRERDRR